MTDRGPGPSADLYSPQHRTALVLSGIGADGAYHAGALRALHEAGVKLDVVAGRGIGVIGALFAAVDGSARLWDEKGFWRASIVRTFYTWRPLLRLMVGAVAIAVALVVVPIAVIAAGLVVFPIDFVAKMVGVASTGGLVTWYLAVADSAFGANGLPTWLPRFVLLVLGLAGIAALVTAWLERGERRRRGPWWWRVLRPPLSARAAVDHCWTVIWDLMRGATHLSQPTTRELARRYAEVLGENLGQPGFRELLLTVHDVDARCDLIFALVGEERRRGLVRRPTIREAEVRRAELVDLSGVGREHLADAVAAALAVPLFTDSHTIQFAAESRWRGETHRLCDRPGGLVRLMEELEGLDVTQVILISAAADSAGPHALAPWRVDGRGRIGEYFQSAEAATVRDVVQAARMKIFPIQPGHNPVGPLDLQGGFDDRSDRREPLEELMSRGYEDAYHQFIEPVVGASGEHIS